MDTCAICQEESWTKPFDVYNESGAGVVQVCDDCRNRLAAKRCSICGTTDTDDDVQIGPHGAPGRYHPLCKSCRRSIIGGEGGEFR